MERTLSLLTVIVLSTEPRFSSLEANSWPGTSTWVISYSVTLLEMEGASIQGDDDCFVSSFITGTPIVWGWWDGSLCVTPSMPHFCARVNRSACCGGCSVERLSPSMLHRGGWVPSTIDRIRRLPRLPGGVCVVRSCSI